MVSADRRPRSSHGRERGRSHGHHGGSGLRSHHQRHHHAGIERRGPAAQGARTPTANAGRPDHRLRHGGDGSRGPSRGRLRLRSQAVQVRRPPAPCAAPARAPGGVSGVGAVSSNGRERGFRQAPARRQCVDARGQDPGRENGSGREQRPHHRRERHRQGTGCQRHPRGQSPARTAIRSHQLRSHSGGSHGKPALRAREGRLHRGRAG